ncbi:MAG: NAD(P)-binding protein, partial [Ruminiclostridium sp.]|nr:NAD(P)-binding protein [Ruminiclostridium sp.]
MDYKPNMSPEKNPMPSLDPKERARCFDEVELGYSEDAAVDEAGRCLNCRNMPCVLGCPVKNHIPEFIHKIRERDFEGAYGTLALTSTLPGVCGRVCTQEKQCEMECVRGKKGEPVAIGRLERFAADWHRTHSSETPAAPERNGHRVAVVGSGPSGLTCAGDLAKKGYSVTIYDALHTAGGVLVYGIPEFRLPKSIVAREIESIKKLGVSIETDRVIGRVKSVDELFEDG